MLWGLDLLGHDRMGTALAVKHSLCSHCGTGTILAMRQPSHLTSMEWGQSGGDSAGCGRPFLLSHQGMETAMVRGLVLVMGLVLFWGCPFHLAITR